jgi:hypothetical protein
MAGIIYPGIERRRAELGTPKAFMARKLGISEQALANKMDGTSEFSAREVRTLALWWNVSADSLIGEAVETAN